MSLLFTFHWNAPISVAFLRSRQHPVNLFALLCFFSLLFLRFSKQLVCLTICLWHLISASDRLRFSSAPVCARRRLQIYFKPRWHLHTCSVERKLVLWSAVGALQSPCTLVFSGFNTPALHPVKRVSVTLISRGFASSWNPIWAFRWMFKWRFSCLLNFLSTALYLVFNCKVPFDWIYQKELYLSRAGRRRLGN